MKKKIEFFDCDLSSGQNTKKNIVNYKRYTKISKKQKKFKKKTHPPPHRIFALDNPKNSFRYTHAHHTRLF